MHGFPWVVVQVPTCMQPATMAAFFKFMQRQQWRLPGSALFESTALKEEEEEGGGGRAIPGNDRVSRQNKTILPPAPESINLMQRTLQGCMRRSQKCIHLIR